ncbi:uncharacterized protein [Physcomitrium patens]|uniref:uncharacterized protein isoform X1 n=1 Tax=Physcomitrium patens TaxID=3218 RepID=UPI000D15FD00|nr:uncharacterized protein LOC112282343 isoform X1 [Physcomitrium patens]|eukprot:XP_024375582.1 uncharacterized protein LOC112282343 isoform X1 [Physcomitrella patens]
MEAMVELPTAVKDNIACWLSDTAGPDEGAMRTATLHLEGAQTAPKFALCLLELAAGGREKGIRVAGAISLKNFLKAHWNAEGVMSRDERLEFRNQLVDVVLRVDDLVRKPLAESFLLVTIHDFVREKAWPELVPALKIAIENIDLMNGSEASDMKALNCLLGLQIITKPFQYFLNPTMASEPVPEQLETISKELLVPFHGTFHQLVQQVATSKAAEYSQHDIILLVFCKSLDHALKSHMPSALLGSVDQWFTDLLSLLDSVVLEERVDSLDKQPRLKIWKRSLQICCNMVSRHGVYVDKFLSSLAVAALEIVGKTSNAKNFNQIQQRVISLGFDLLANILQTEVGWKLIASHFPNLLDKAIFPALMMNEKDLSEWVEEEDEYIQKNLPSNMDVASGSTEDLVTPRRRALNLLGIIAMAKGPQSVRRRKKAGTVKRRRIGSKGANKDDSDRVGDILVMLYLARYPLPTDGADVQSDEVLRYYGALIAYGGLQKYLKTLPAAKVALLLERRVFPLYLMVAPSPYVLANANWILGELSSCLPEVLRENVYTALLKALLAPNAGCVSWRPVRASAAAALASLLQNGYKPIQWLPLLQATVAGVRMEKESEAAISLQLLTIAVETGREFVASYVPAIAAVVQVVTCKNLPSNSEPWPQVAELGFSAIAALAKAWEAALSDKDKSKGKDSDKWMVGCATVANVFSELLQRAWLVPLQEGAMPVKPQALCLSDASVLLKVILRYGQSSADVVEMKMESLVRVWANLVAASNGWDAHGDEPVFDCIDELIALQERCSIIQFSLSEVMPSSAPETCERSILDCVVTFLTTAIDSASSAACWRACRNVHALLHATQFSLEGEALMAFFVPRFCEVASRRLQQLTSMTVPLAKPLILVITVCFINLPEEVEKILCFDDNGPDVTEDGSCQGLLTLAEALAGLAESEADPSLSLESEMKITVIGLQRVMVHIINKNLLQNQNGFTAAHHCLRSLLESMVELKDIMELSESDESGSSSTSNSDSGFSSEDDSLDETRSEPVAATQEETEGEFLERQAQTARDLQAEACEEAENGQNEDGHELALGPQLNHSTPTRETLPKLYFAQPTCNIHSILLPITPSRQRETVSCTLAPHASSRMNAS